MREPPRSAKAQTQSSATRKTIPQCLFNVGDPGTLILECETQPTPVALLQTFKQ